MIAQLLNRGFILERLRELRSQLEDEFDDRRRVRAPEGGGEEGLSDEEGTTVLTLLREAEVRESQLSSGQPGFDAPSSERRRVGGDEGRTLDDVAFFSRDPIINIVQSALEEYYEEHEGTVDAGQVMAAREEDDDRRRGGRNDEEGGGEEVAVTSLKLAGAVADEEEDEDGRRSFSARDDDEEDSRRLLNQFSLTDPRWVNAKIAEGIRWFRGRHEFNESPPPPAQVSDRVRLILAGDWATGLPRAQKVATGMRRSVEEGVVAGREVHVIHLGDVYYSGWKREYKKRFFPYWPVRPDEADSIGSWCLNANHDMYSGGYAYYDYLLADPRFKRQGRSSFFELFNQHWRILSLDTGWENGDLKDPQAKWVEQRASADGRKLMLLSHHQLFTVYDHDCDVRAGEKLKGVLDAGLVRAWFWGHEHRCVIYRSEGGVAYPRCIGHGGVPAWMFRDEADPYLEPAIYEYRGRFWKGAEPWALMGFAVLDFEPEGNVKVSYVDENGYTHKQEVLE